MSSLGGVGNKRLLKAIDSCNAMVVIVDFTAASRSVGPYVLYSIRCLTSCRKSEVEQSVRKQLIDTVSHVIYETMSAVQSPCNNDMTPRFVDHTIG